MDRWVILANDTTGMIRPGYAADFIIIDRDVLEIDPNEIARTEVLMTVLGGKSVYEAAHANQAD